MTAKVVMYSKTTCPYCHRAERLLRERGITDSDLDLIQIDIERSRRAEMIDRAHRSTVPQIFIDGKHVGGCDDLVELDRQGGLVPLLEAS
jgi:glutaredoxin 3